MKIWRVLWALCQWLLLYRLSHCRMSCQSHPLQAQMCFGHFSLPLVSASPFPLLSFLPGLLPPFLASIEKNWMHCGTELNALSNKQNLMHYGTKLTVLWYRTGYIMEQNWKHFGTELKSIMEKTKLNTKDYYQNHTKSIFTSQNSTNLVLTNSF